MLLRLWLDAAVHAGPERRTRHGQWEREVVALVAWGLSNRQIASTLRWGRGTWSSTWLEACRRSYAGAPRFSPTLPSIACSCQRSRHIGTGRTRRWTRVHPCGTAIPTSIRVRDGGIRMPMARLPEVHGSGSGQGGFCGWHQGGDSHPVTASNLSTRFGRYCMRCSPDPDVHPDPPPRRVASRR